MPIQHGCRQCFRSGHILPSIHPSLHPSIALFLCDSRKDTTAFQERQRSDRIKIKWSLTPMKFLLFINLSISLSDTYSCQCLLALLTWFTYCKVSAHTHTESKYTSRDTHIQACVQSTSSYVHRYTPGRPTTQPRIRPSFIDVC